MSSLTLDVRECECMQVLLTVYPQLVRHWKAAGNIEKVVHFLIESSAAAVAVEESLQVGRRLSRTLCSFSPARCARSGKVSIKHTACPKPAY